MRKLSIKILVVVGLIIAGLLVWWQLSGDEQKKPVTSALQTKDDLLRTLISVHTRVFSRDNLLITPVSTEDQVAWGDMAAGIQRFVEAKNDKLIGDFNTITSVSLQLITTLREVYKMMSPAFVAEKDKEKGLSSFDANKIDFNKLRATDFTALVRSNLSARKAELLALEATLKNKLQEYRDSWMPGTKAKGDVCEILLYYAQIVEATIQKVFNDTAVVFPKFAFDVRQL